MKIGLIYAQGSNGAFGLKNRLPWSGITEDMKHFSAVTKGHAVLMGRNTWDSLPEKYRPLPGRLNIVLSSKAKASCECQQNNYSVAAGNPLYANTFEQAMLYTKLNRLNELWIIGGAGLLEQMQNHASVAFVTEIFITTEYDVSAPKLDDSWEQTNARSASVEGVLQSGYNYRFLEYRRRF